MITRRKFFKLIGLGALVTMVPIPEETVKVGPGSEYNRIPMADIPIRSYKEGQFNPSCEYGRGVEMTRLNDEFVIQWLHQDARRILSKGTPYELRAELYRNDRFRAGWIYEPNFTGRKKGLYGVRLEPYIPPRGIMQDSWGDYRPELGIWIRGIFYA